MKNQKNIQLALCMIVKPSDSEAELLKRCLTYIAPHVDGVFLTITGDNKRCEDVAKAFGAHVSKYEWDYSFANARNYALSQVPEEYDYWMWLDCDDIVRGAEKIKPTILDNPTIDAFVMNYLYAFDEHKNPIVVHMKSRILRHDGCVEWMGDLHEDFHSKREVSAKLVEGIDILHLTDDERIDVARTRNIEVAEKMAEKLPDDPRSYWNLGNSYKAGGENKKAIEAFNKFLETSQSEDEKYVVYIRLAEIYLGQNEFSLALDMVNYAIGVKFDYPDGFILKGHIYFTMQQWDKAIVCYKKAAVIVAGFNKREKSIYNELIVYNPREYDYNLLMAMAKTYFQMELPQLALPLLEQCLVIYPEDEGLKRTIKKMKKRAKIADKAMEEMTRLEKIDDLEVLEKEIDKLPVDIKSHPAICNLKNVKIVKTESSGKDLVIFCGFTEELWTPDTALEKGIGGSEEAVIHLSQGLSDLGWNVTVYNKCGHKELQYGDVKWKPFWSWNYRDKQDVVVLWRSPKMLDYDINADKIVIDLHDVIKPGELNEKRMEKCHKVFVKSKAHRNLFPEVPDEKFAIVPNGIVWEDLQGEIERDPNLIICTSSPDRHLSAVLKGFKEIKKQVPKAKFQWAYGWGVWDIVHGDEADAMEWKRKMIEDMESMEGFEALGRVSHIDVAEMYQRAGVFGYPTAFFEIDCISARKAQAGGATLVTTDFAALDETVKYGTKISVNGEGENWGKPYQFDFAVQDQKVIDKWVKECVKALKKPASEKDRMKQREAMKEFSWPNISKSWDKMLK